MRSSSRLATSCSAATTFAANASWRAAEPSCASGSNRASKRSTSSRGDARVSRERVFDVGLTERRADLAQVLRVRAEDRHVAAREAGSQHQAVEAVALGLASPEPSECLAERRPVDVVVERLEVGAAQPDVVDPKGRSRGGMHLVRSLVDDSDAHVLEQGQDVRERHRLADAEELHPHDAARCVRRAGHHRRHAARRSHFRRGPPSSGCRRRQRADRHPPDRRREARRRTSSTGRGLAPRRCARRARRPGRPSTSAPRRRGGLRSQGRRVSPAPHLLAA